MGTCRGHGGGGGVFLLGVELVPVLGLTPLDVEGRGPNLHLLLFLGTLLEGVAEFLASESLRF